MILVISWPQQQYTSLFAGIKNKYFFWLLFVQLLWSAVQQGIAYSYDRQHSGYIKFVSVHPARVETCWQINTHILTLILTVVNFSVGRL